MCRLSIVHSSSPFQHYLHSLPLDPVLLPYPLLTIQLRKSRTILSPSLCCAETSVQNPLLLQQSWTFLWLVNAVRRRRSRTRRWRCGGGMEGNTEERYWEKEQWRKWCSSLCPMGVCVGLCLGGWSFSFSFSVIASKCSRCFALCGGKWDSVENLRESEGKQIFPKLSFASLKKKKIIQEVFPA